MKQVSLYTKDQAEMLLRFHKRELPTTQKPVWLFFPNGDTQRWAKVKSGKKWFYELQHGTHGDVTPCDPKKKIFHVNH